jgi:hypothetical protein
LSLTDCPGFPYCTRIFHKFWIEFGDWSLYCLDAWKCTIQTSNWWFVEIVTILLTYSVAFDVTYLLYKFRYVVMFYFIFAIFYDIAIILSALIVGYP